MSNASCQNQNLFSASSRVGFPMTAAYRLKWSLWRDGLWGTLGSIGRMILRKRGLWKPLAKPAGGSSQADRLRLQPGEWVQVKDESEIRATLDSSGRQRGLLFMPEMAAHCGRRFRVHKRLERMIVESTGELRRVKNTVLLENSMCNGVGMSCDRSCYFFWRESWLERTESPEAAK